MQILTTSPAMGSATGSSAPMIAPKKKSGCGCCGCFVGCLLILLLSGGTLIGAFFFLDLGKIADRAVGFSYYQFARPWMVEALSQKGSEQDKEEVMLIADTYVATYLNLPESEKKPLRQELMLYLYYGAQGKPVGQDKIPHILKLYETVTQKVFQDNPNLVPPVFNPDPTAPPTPPKLIEPARPPIAPAPEKPVPRLVF